MIDRELRTSWSWESDSGCVNLLLGQLLSGQSSLVGLVTGQPYGISVIWGSVIDGSGMSELYISRKSG